MVFNKENKNLSIHSQVNIEFSEFKKAAYTIHNFYDKFKDFLRALTDNLSPLFPTTVSIRLISLFFKGPLSISLNCVYPFYLSILVENLLTIWWISSKYRLI